MTSKEINTLYKLTNIEVVEDDRDDEIVALKRGDLKKAAAVAIELVVSLYPARKMIRKELDETVSAYMAVIAEDGDDEDFYLMCRNKLSQSTSKDEILNILKDAVKALEEDDDE